MTDASILTKQPVIANIRSRCFKYGLSKATEGPIHL